MTIPKVPPNEADIKQVERDRSSQMIQLLLEKHLALWGCPTEDIPITNIFIFLTYLNLFYLGLAEMMSFSFPAKQ